MTNFINEKMQAFWAWNYGNYTQTMSQDKRNDDTTQADPVTTNNDSRKEKIGQIEKYKQESTLLIHNIKQLQQLNNKLNNDLVYIQDYVSKLIKQWMYSIVYILLNQIHPKPQLDFFHVGRFHNWTKN